MAGLFAALCAVRQRDPDCSEAVFCVQEEKAAACSASGGRLLGPGGGPQRCEDPLTCKPCTGLEILDRLASVDRKCIDDEYERFVNPGPEPPQPFDRAWLRFLGFDHGQSTKPCLPKSSITANFRKLVIKYHPDKMAKHKPAHLRPECFVEVTRQLMAARDIAETQFACA